MAILQVHSIALKSNSCTNRYPTRFHERSPRRRRNYVDRRLGIKVLRWPSTQPSRSNAGVRCTSAILTARASAAPARTLTDCNASASFEVLISACTAPGNPPSTLGPQTLAWKTPVEALDQLSINKPRVATTPLNPANEPSRFIAKSSPLPAWSAQWADVVTHMITSRRPRCRGLGGRGVLPAAAAVQNMNNPKSANPSDFWRRIGF
jgi:hypothetical protein